MTRAILTGCLLGCCALAGYALGRVAERRDRNRRDLRALLTLFPNPDGPWPVWEQTEEGLWRLRSGGAL